MGSYVSIGFVYEKNREKELVEQLEKIIGFLKIKNEDIKRIKYCEDDFGEIECEVNLNDIVYHKNEILKKIVDYFYGEIEFFVDIFEMKKLKMILRIEKEDDLCGITLDIEESDLIHEHTVSNINIVTEKIIDFMIQVNTYLNYDYAVCDNELELKYSPEIIKNMKELKYSVLIIFDGKLKVMKSNWNIDGLTQRK